VDASPKAVQHQLEPNRAERGIRRDIQLLRGIAVLAVVIFHASPSVLPKGLLGVDVFFVISGYLMTGMILREVDAGSFSFSRFYYRRAKRLLPACYSTLLVVTLVGYVAMTREQWPEYLRELVASLTFTANFELAAHVNYFTGDARNSPLLHIWSLSLEEQYYLVLPAALVLVAWRYRSWLLATGAALSFAVCVWLASGYPIPGVTLSLGTREQLAFYMLPARAWELLLGSLCGLVMLRHPSFRCPGLLKYCALAAMFFTFVIGADTIHPRTDAAIATLATCVILLGSGGWLVRNWLTSVVAIIGDWSYSLYLVHWPLLSFGYQLFAGEVPGYATAIMVLASVGLAWAQYRYVETPFRKIQWPIPRFAWLRIAAGALAVVAFAAPAMILLEATPPPFAEALQPNRGLALDCQSHPGRSDACATSLEPAVAVWGDSYAMQLVSGLAADGNPLIQLTRSACAPIIGVSTVNASASLPEAVECEKFNRRALDDIVRSRSIRAVVISSTFNPLISDDDVLVDGKRRRYYSDSPERLEATVRAISAAGKTPMLVAPMPAFGFDVALCNVRQLEGLPVLGRRSCSPGPAEIPASERQLIDILRRVSNATGARLYRAEFVLCSDRCRTRVGSNLIYRDPHHLSRWGSSYVIPRLGITRDIAALPSVPATPPK